MLTQPSELPPANKDPGLQVALAVLAASKDAPAIAIMPMRFFALVVFMDFHLKNDVLKVSGFLIADFYG
jgi:hypothetical protein